MTFLFAKTPVLTNSENFYDIINSLPVGILILEYNNNFLLNDYKISYSNSLAKKLLFIKTEYDLSEFCKISKEIKEFSVSDKISKISLYEFIFNSIDGNKKFLINNSILFFKTKHKNSKIYIVIDNYDDERINIQKSYLNNIGENYVSTLYHEINNPLNCLLMTISELINDKMLEIKKRIEFLVFLLKVFLKNFILFFQISKLTKENIKSNTTINLKRLFDKINLKYSQLFQYKRITFVINLDISSDKCVNLDYYYFKNLLKNLFIYFYQHTRNGGFFIIQSKEILSKNGRSIKVTFSNNKIDNSVHRSYSTYDAAKSLACFIKHNTENIIQTEKINIDILNKLSNCLNIKIEFTKKKDISIYIPLEEESFFESNSENENQIEKIQNFNNKIVEESKEEEKGFETPAFKHKKKVTFHSQIISKSPRKSLRSNSVIEIEKIQELNNSNIIKTNYENYNNYFEERKINISTQALNNKETICSRHFTKRYKEINKTLKNICRNDLLIPNSKTFHLNDDCIQKITKKVSESDLIKKNDILIVDDEQFNLNALSNILKKLNLSSDTCYDGEECIKIILDQLKEGICQYKLIFMDIVMPIMNGLLTVEKIQGLCNENKIDKDKLNIVFISASYDQKENVKNLRKSCPIIKDFLVKPIKVTQIKEVLNNFYK